MSTSTYTHTDSLTDHLREAIGTHLARCDGDDISADDAKGLLLLALGDEADADADDWSAEYTDDAWRLVEPGWHADNGNADLHYDTAESGDEAASDYVSEGDWGDSDRTSWVHVTTWRRSVTIDSDGDVDEVKIDQDTHTVEIEPTEPDCADGHEHEWTNPHDVVGGVEGNPGCWGNGGGGIILHEVCPHCGWTRITDTWAQDPVTGEQGLTSVEYQDDPDNRQTLERLTVEEARRCGEGWGLQGKLATETLTLTAADWNAIREAGHGGILDEELCETEAQDAYDEALGR